MRGPVGVGRKQPVDNADLVNHAYAERHAEDAGGHGETAVQPFRSGGPHTRAASPWRA